MSDIAPDPFEQESVSLRQSMWRRIADYRFSRRVPTKSAAVRALLEFALNAMDEMERSQPQPKAEG